MYRTSQNSNEILGLLKSINFPGEHILWQNFGGDRSVFSIIDLEIMPSGLEVKIVLDEIPLKFSPKFKVYLKLGHDETIFKVDVLQIFDNVIMITFPDEIRTVEQRSVPRLRFKPKDNKLVTLSYEVDIVNRARTQSLFQVIDISKGGFSVVCGQQKMSNIVHSGDIRLLRLGHLTLLLETHVNLVHYQSFKYKREGKVTKAYRVGFKFARPLPKEIFERYLLSS